MSNNKELLEMLRGMGLQPTILGSATKGRSIMYTPGNTRATTVVTPHTQHRSGLRPTAADKALLDENEQKDTAAKSAPLTPAQKKEKKRAKAAGPQPGGGSASKGLQKPMSKVAQRAFARHSAVLDTAFLYYQTQDARSVAHANLMDRLACGLGADEPWGEDVGSSMWVRVLYINLSVAAGMLHTDRIKARNSMFDAIEILSFMEERMEHIVGLRLAHAMAHYHCMLDEEKNVLEGTRDHDNRHPLNWGLITGHSFYDLFKAGGESLAIPTGATGTSNVRKHGFFAPPDRDTLCKMYAESFRIYYKYFEDRELANSNPPAHAVDNLPEPDPTSVQFKEVMKIKIHLLGKWKRFHEGRGNKGDARELGSWIEETKTRLQEGEELARRQDQPIEEVD